MYVAKANSPTPTMTETTLVQQPASNDFTIQIGTTRRISINSSYKEQILLAAYCETSKIGRRGRIPLYQTIPGRRLSYESDKRERAADDSLPSAEPYENEERLRIVLQPETRPISSDQLIAEVKGIYAGLIMVEAKCCEVDAKQHQQALVQDDPKSSLNNEQWYVSL
jgi:hypothetical protein